MEDQGAKGEAAAARYLQENGYKVLERNWSFGQKEIDIIAEKDEQLIVAEVKTQRNRRFGAPEFRVNKMKQQHLVQAANGYILKKEKDQEVRFDVLAVIINDRGEEVHHIQNAFGPRW